MRLTREERRKIFAGEYPTLIREVEPEVEPGTVIILSWSRPRPYAGEDGTVYAPPRHPLLWLTVNGIVRRQRGGWSIHYDVGHRREGKRLVRRKPPVYDAELMEADLHQPPSAEDIAEAHQQSAYTSDPSQAADHLEAVDDVWLARHTAEARAIESTAEALSDQEKANERRLKSKLEQDLAEALREAEAMGIDTSSVRHITERQVARLRKRMERVQRAA